MFIINYMEYKSWHTGEPLPEDKVTKVYYPDTDKKEDSTKKASYRGSFKTSRSESDAIDGAAKGA